MKREVLEITVDISEEMEKEIRSLSGGENINGFIHDLIVRGLSCVEKGSGAA